MHICMLKILLFYHDQIKSSINNNVNKGYTTNTQTITQFIVKKYVVFFKLKIIYDVFLTYK